MSREIEGKLISMAKAWQTNTIFEEDKKFFVTVQMPSNESENVRRSSGLGHAEDAGPFDSLQDAEKFEGTNKKRTMDKYKVLVAPTDKLEEQLNALALENWTPVSISVIPAQSGGIPMALMVLEKVKPQHGVGSFVK